jgi:hypothetical protein
MLSNDLSPENLSCDGELPMAEVISRSRFLKKVASQLKAMDPSIQIHD